MNDISVPRFPAAINDLAGDLFNPPLAHSCMADCGATVTPDPDGAIPALCVACRTAPPPVKLYHNGHAYAAPPTAPESPWARFIRLGDKAVDANGVQVHPLAADYTSFTVSSQSVPGRWHTVQIGALVRCTCQGFTLDGGCAHCAACYRWLLAQRAALAPVVYAPRRPVVAYAAAVDDCFASKAEKRVA